jgi:mevalonate kinase
MANQKIPARPGSDASAPGKIILCGEHAVVYGAPAIALPLLDIRASTQIEPGASGSGMQISAPATDEAWSVADVPDHPLSELAIATLRRLEALPVLGATLPDMTVTLRSDIPIARGMGSGAAVATALVRALAAHIGGTLPPDIIADLVYSCEQRYHGTPSGIDNTVIAFERAIWFERQKTEYNQPGHWRHGHTQ